ncbi:M1-specific T cell receptor alpha chain-like isoform X2 [Synchiropus splendidus]|uniref:M1-specific T cell receptor alpha chain-like isoform X2 n=1 Tax=Synchiropus splendidus TaxID=270530 RepID=UPI00237E93E1|nr:M1-specific T cell receptor alpha chain-like isoform X2 [Synchiropus splendidus]
MQILVLFLSDLESSCFCCQIFHSETGGIGKLVFGSGSRMTVESGNEVGPSFFRLDGENMVACLATGFTRHKAVNDSDQRELFELTDAARITGSSMFSQLALLNDADKDKCEAGIVIEDPCDEVVETDEKMNLTTLTLLVLRLLFIKTLVFNVLMSLRFWTRE